MKRTLVWRKVATYIVSGRDTGNRGVAQFLFDLVEAGVEDVEGVVHFLLGDGEWRR
jgi:hypothetical protein